MVSPGPCSSFVGAERPLRWQKRPDSGLLNPSDVRVLLNGNIWWVTSGTPEDSRRPRLEPTSPFLLKEVYIPKSL